MPHTLTLIMQCLLMSLQIPEKSCRPDQFVFMNVSPMRNPDIRNFSAFFIANTEEIPLSDTFRKPSGILPAMITESFNVNSENPLGTRC